MARPAMEPAPTTSDAPAGHLTAEPRRPGRGRRRPGCGAALVDVGLGAGALADPERLLEQDVEGRADGAELLAEAERVAGLAEDLALADGHRVEPGRHLEQVRDGAVVVVDVEVRQHRLGRLAGPVDEQPRQLLDAAVEPVDVGVDLDPVAGRDHGGLGDVLAGRDVLDELGHGLGVERDLLEQGAPGRCCGTCPRRGRSCRTASGAWALRCSW